MHHNKFWNDIFSSLLYVGYGCVTDIFIIYLTDQVML
jgi:hypothetical protein